MSWYIILDKIDAIWEVDRVSILLSVGVVIAVFLAISIIAGISRHFEEIKR